MREKMNVEYSVRVRRPRECAWVGCMIPCDADEIKSRSKALTYHFLKPVVRSA